MHSCDSLEIRLATLADRDAIQQLINESSRKLATDDYTHEQVEIALRAVLGVDSRLIEDGTYFLAVTDGKIVGCGGWSCRKTMFGGDRIPERDNTKLDPAVDAAKIRALYVLPRHAREGIGTKILEHCESEARRHGFHRLELGATLPGHKLFRTCGFVSGEAFEYECEPGTSLTIIPMSKDISPD
jgi:GNAT superfamily N-acetyltransferase